MYSLINIITITYFFNDYSEIIGFIDGIEAPRYVGENKQFKFFKFFVNNGCGKRIQIVAWNDEIDRIEHDIKLNFVSISYLYIYK